MGEQELTQLIDFLSTVPKGIVNDETKAKLIPILNACWYDFQYRNEGKMEAYKLTRMAEPLWVPPKLIFEIERHGATALGSSRAEIQQWVINIETREADVNPVGHRQIYKIQAKFDVKPIADELAKKIQKGKKDPRLKWSSTGSEMDLSSNILPRSSKKTMEGRRKRLSFALEERLEPLGWESNGSWWSKQ